jgi:hypothetical protein
MSTLQAVIFGMMLSWTPSIVLLAFLLWRERIGLPEDLNSKSKSPAKIQVAARKPPVRARPLG